MDLSLSTRAVGADTVVAIAGEIDVYTAPKLRDHLVDIDDAGQHRIVLDLDGVTFLDSTGLGVLVGVLKRLRAHGGELLVACAQERPLKVFRLTGLDELFTIRPSVDEALLATAPVTEVPGGCADPAGDATPV